MGRNIILDDEHDKSIPLMRQILDGYTAIYWNETIASSNLCSAIRHLWFSQKEYLDYHNKLLSNDTTDDLEHYKEQINSELIEEGQVFIIEVTRLSFYLSSYLIYVKAVLDKFIPLIQFRHNFKDSVFKRRGQSLRKFTEKIYQGDNRDEIVNFIDQARKEWIDETLKLRDNFVHNITIAEYEDFRFVKNTNQKLDKLSDCKPPSILFDGTRIEAKSFIIQTTKRLTVFISGLIKLYNLKSYHPPGLVLKCPNCNYQYGNFLSHNQLKILDPITVQTQMKKYDHGYIGCPKCSTAIDVSLSSLEKYGIKY